MWSCLMGGLSAHSRDSAALCQVSNEPESLSQLSGTTSSSEATPVVVDVLSEEVKCNKFVAT